MASCLTGDKEKCECFTMWPKEKPYSAQLNIYYFCLDLTDKILRPSKFCEGLKCRLLLYLAMCKIYFPILPSINIKHI